MNLSEQAVKIIKDAYRARIHAQQPHDSRTLARLYDTWPQVIDRCLYKEGFEMGALTARKILRASMAHLEAQRNGQYLTEILDKQKYKGTR